MPTQNLPAPADAALTLNDSYIGSEFTVAAVHEFFVASQWMFRAAPWRVVPEFAAVFAVNCASLGLLDAVVAVVGPPAASYGTMVFASVEDFASYRRATRALAASTAAIDAMSIMPAWLGSEFRPGAAISVRMLHEIKTHGWPIAGPVAFPIITAMAACGHSRAATARDVQVLTTLHHAVADLINAELRLGFAWEPGSLATTRTMSVQLGANVVAITLTAPHPNVALPWADAAAGANPPSKAHRAAGDNSKAKAKRKAQKAARKKNR